MHPILFRIGSLPIGTYALMALIALFVGCAVFSGLAARDGRSRIAFVEMGLWSFIIALAASKVFGALVDFNPDHPADSIKKVLRFGGHYYIGVIAGVAFLVIAFRRQNVPFGTGLDYLAPALSMAHGIGRIGCFMAGCCWGSACDRSWAVTFTSAEAHQMTGVPLNVALHPTQLYEFGAEMLIAALLLWKFMRRRGRPGTTFLLYIACYGVVRFLVEFVRDDPRGTFLDAPTSQPLALATSVIALVALFLMRGEPGDGTRGRRRHA